VFTVRTQLHICVVEGQRSPRNMPGSHRWEINSVALLILSSALDGVVISATPSRYNRGKGPGTHCTGGWLGRRTGLDGCGEEKMSCARRFLNPEPSNP
jgi:hypothetical protein